MAKENIQKKYHESLKERGITNIEVELIGRLYGVKLLDAEKKHHGQTKILIHNLQRSHECNYSSVFF
ncbi:hypothetical protein PSG86_12460 [Enterococcus faecalis]|uniref:hypothetical protein n=1 Tax=Enterococcus faecalis TaxID=1351 RepID=UPI001A0EC95C|nr:hypothetical protein [Enterococcus faecalis]EGO6012500.1 hypothetical protein [Enterococcus faecalis]MDV7842765.1 hypothetical protein [Enterococcus faecalis]MDV7857345.1 hypothetical protein [Enterococcus faecalis]